MITELNNQDFYKIRYITDKSRNIEVKAVINGNNPGRVYVDHPMKATAALIWIQGQEGFQIVGDAQSKSFFNRFKRIHEQSYRTQTKDAKY